MRISDNPQEKKNQSRRIQFRAFQVKRQRTYALIGLAIIFGLLLVITFLSMFFSQSSKSIDSISLNEDLKQDIKGRHLNQEGPQQEANGEDIQFYNPYDLHFGINNQNEVHGVLTALTEYDKIKHAKALRKLTSSYQSPKDFTIDPRFIPEGINNKLLTNLSFSFSMQDYRKANILFTDNTAQRFSIPSEVVNKPYQDVTMRLEMMGLKVHFFPFSFQFEDLRDPSNVYLHTNASTFVMMDKFIQIDFQIQSQRLYGFGERNTESFTLKQGTWMMWSKSNRQVLDNGRGGDQGSGVHPFVLIQSGKKGDFFGIYFRNSNAQSPLLKFKDDGGSTLSYITTGGQLEIQVYMHGTPKQIIAEYLHAIGHPDLPPFYSLGWMQGSRQYTDLDHVKQVIGNYQQAGLPLPHIWVDYSYMQNNNQGFTVNQTSFKDLDKFADQLHDNQQKLILSIFGELPADDPNYVYLQRAKGNDTLIKSAINKDKFDGYLSAQMISNHTVFMDFLAQNAQKVWSDGLNDLYSKSHFDGLYFELNEFATTCSGECPDIEVSLNADQKNNYLQKLRMMKEKIEESFDKENRLMDDSSWYQSYQDQSSPSTYFLPFIPGSVGGNLDNHTISLNATHQGGQTEYNYHNLNGLLMTKATYKFLTQDQSYPNTDNRPFLSSQATFTSSGGYISHPISFNIADWSWLKVSIAAIMNMNMFGIPHSGSDICGYYTKNQDSTLDQELCARWIQLSQFYPLARFNYNQVPNEPYLLQGQWLSIAKASMYSRFQYMRLLYTCMFETKWFGNTCFDPLFYYYPYDESTFGDRIEESFIFAGALKVSPILEQGVTGNYQSYFPKGKWVSMRDFSEIITGPGMINLQPHATVNVHLRPGSLIAFQDNKDFSINNTNLLLERPISIVANRDENGVAAGSLFLDKGLSRRQIDSGSFEYYKLTIQSNTMQKYLDQGNHATQKVKFDKLILLNAQDLSDVDFACVFTLQFKNPMQTSYNAIDQTLTLSVPTPVDFFSFKQIVYGSTRKGDPNLCDLGSYQYHIKNGNLPDLTKAQQSLILSNYNGNMPDLNLTLRVLESNMVNVQWTFAQLPQGYRQPFQIPDEIIEQKPTRPNQQLRYFVNVTDKPFKLVITNRQGIQVANIDSISFDQYFNFYSANLNTTKGSKFTGIFGLGERVLDNIFYNDGIYSLWNRDIQTPFDDGRPAGKNEYGTHPFYMYKNDDQMWVGVYTNVANAQDWYVANDPPRGLVNLMMVSVGGIGDVYFIVDSDPNNVAGAYLEIVGKPVLVPQWALGWHQCKWGYLTLQDVKDVVANYAKYNLPLDTQWTDIDYLNSYRDFTYDEQRFQGLPEFVNELHAKNMRYVPIIDAGISFRSKGIYSSLDTGLEQDVYLKIGNNQNLIGEVWPKDSVYPDFWAPNTPSWWKQQCTLLHDTVAVDGIWLDMNEASDFCGGACYPDQDLQTQAIKYKTKYTPAGRDLEYKQIPLDGYHASKGWLQFDTHSLYATMQIKTTHDWFKENNMRTFIISRASFAGQGKYGSLWLGDNFSELKYMKQSVTGVMMMNIFGIPFVGSDICGFIGNTNPELCARWYVIGAFQPFSRNHNNWGQTPQEPYQFANDFYEEGITYTDIMRNAMRAKLSLIRYYYSLFFINSQDGGAPVYKPLFFEYPDDQNAYQDIHNNVMIGTALKISHLSDQIGTNQSNFYFPKGVFCNVFNHKERCINSTGEFRPLRTLAYDYYVHLREGQILPFQNATQLNSNTTYDLQQQPIDLFILGTASYFPGTTWTSEAIYVNDNGTVLNLDGNFNKYQIQAQHYISNGVQKIQIHISNQPAYNYNKKDGSYCTAINGNDYLRNIVIFNAKNSLALNKFTTEVLYINGTEQNLGNANYDVLTDRLVLNNNSPICMSAVALITFYKLA